MVTEIKTQALEMENKADLILTENQEKVIKDKYLKDAPSIEAWLDLVSGNIALAELLYDPSVDKKKIFEGINRTVKQVNISGKTSFNYLLHDRCNTFDEQHKNFKKYLKNLYVLSEQQKNNSNYHIIKRKFYNMMARFEFLPNSPTLMNAGRALQQLSACYVLPIDDSMDGIYSAVKNMALVHQSGGGTGFDFSRLRPKGDFVKSTRGVASGPISFMSIFDKSTDVVKQGGQRRGANMGILRYDHPDIMEFISAKKQQGILENFNISVAVDKKFMEAVKKGEEYDLLNPRTKEPTGKLNAKEVFDTLVKSAWETADPGILFIDRINQTDSNPTPTIGKIEATNPCGEQPLLPYEPCNLGSINLSKFVLTDGSDMDWPRLKKCISLAIRFLDNVIDVNNFPIKEIEEMAKGNRRIGFGVMGWAETLVKLGLPYNSEEALEKAEKVMKFVNVTSLEASEALAKERGVFPNWENSIYDANGRYYRGKPAKPRHAARTTLAPTGTIGIAAGLQGAGIEPFFAVVYVRYNAAAIDALKRGEKPDYKDTFYEVNPLFMKVAKENKFFGMEPEELWKKIEENHKSVAGLDFIPKEIQNLFLTSHDLTPLDHVRMQCAFQKHTNNAVSKTVNLKNEATVQDIEEVYMLAYNLGAKGVTVYRDGSKQFQILNLSEKKKAKQEILQKACLRRIDKIIKEERRSLNQG